MAGIVDRSGVDIVSVGDSVGPTMWGLGSEHDVTLEQMLLACTAVRRGVTRALVSCDFPGRVIDEGVDAVNRAARRLSDEGGADAVKVDRVGDAPEIVQALTNAGISVWAQFGSPDLVRLKADTTNPKADTTNLKADTTNPKADTTNNAQTAREVEHWVAIAKRMESAGAVMLNFIHSGPIAGPAVVQAVSIPVLGGLGGGPWLDGRVRVIGNAIGYLARALDDEVERYANVARITFDAITAYADDVRGGRHIKGEPL
jgi:3-methyl-2-oxobutanoate hydroxymethyltransferase